MQPIIIYKLLSCQSSVDSSKQLFKQKSSSITGYLARLIPMVISGSQHPLKVDYSILKYYTFMGE